MITMNLTEKNAVMDFLRKKKLSYPLYKEVLDHFFIDIDDKMNDGLGFQEAFLQTKLKWHKEFEMVHPDPLSIRKLPRIEASLIGNHFRRISKIASLSAMFSLLIFALYKPAFTVIIIGLSAVLIALVTYSVVSGKISLFNYIRLSFHPLILRGIIASLLLVIFFGFFSDSFSSSRLDFKEAITFAIAVFNIVVQIQLVLFQNRKINVLAS